LFLLAPKIQPHAEVAEIAEKSTESK